MCVTVPKKPKNPKGVQRCTGQPTGWLESRLVKAGTLGKAWLGEDSFCAREVRFD